MWWVNLYKAISVGNRKKCTWHTLQHTSALELHWKEISHKKKSLILFTQNDQNRSIYRDRKEINNCQGFWRWSKMGLTANGFELSLWNNENVLKWLWDGCLAQCLRFHLECLGSSLGYISYPGFLLMHILKESRLDSSSTWAPPPTSETCSETWTPGSGLVQTQLLQASEEWTSRWQNFCLFAFCILNETKKKFLVLLLFN